jgi:FixJ family two-component response regulator
MNGLELLELLRQRSYMKPAIVIAASTDPRLADRMLKAGVTDTLQKPIAPATLLHAIRSAIDNRPAISTRLRT